MMLKPQDVLVLLKLSVLKDTVWSYAGLAKALKMSVAEVHDGLKRATAARLFNPLGPYPERLLFWLPESRVVKQPESLDWL